MSQVLDKLVAADGSGATSAESQPEEISSKASPPIFHTEFKDQCEGGKGRRERKKEERPNISKTRGIL